MKLSDIEESFELVRQGNAQKICPSSRVSIYRVTPSLVRVDIYSDNNKALGHKRNAKARAYRRTAG